MFNGKNKPQEHVFLLIVYISSFFKQHEDKAPFYLDLAKNYQSYVADYAVSANFLLTKSYSRWQNLCAMWHLCKCGNS